MRTNQNISHGKLPFPVIGNRILKTALAVFLCLLIHMIRGYRGGVAESCITAIICMQPYVKDARKSALDRMAGTVLGSVWGLAVLLLLTGLQEADRYMLFVYGIMTLGVILSIYSCILLNIPDTAALAAIVYLCLVLDYPQADITLPQIISRILDTLLGVLAAVAVNSFHIPTRKRKDRIFFLKLTHLAEDRYSHISPRVLTELNRLYDSGAKICLETEYAPAFLIGQLNLLHINMPVIVLGGAALYDIRENSYMEVQEIPQIGAYYLQKMIESLGYCGIFFTLRGNSMMLFQTGERSSQEEEDYRMMRRSPYRNYVRGLFSGEDRVLAFRMILDEREADSFEEKLMQDRIITRCYSVARLPRPKHTGEILLYFYKKGVSLEETQKRMVEYEQDAEEKKLQPIQIRPVSSRYSPERDAVQLLHRIRKLYRQPFWVRDDRKLLHKENKSSE